MSLATKPHHRTSNKGQSPGDRHFHTQNRASNLSFSRIDCLVQMDYFFQIFFLFSLLTAGAYALGSINTSIVALRLLHEPDPRACGSGNPGATNTLRSAGIKVALPVLLIDVGKAYGIIWLGRTAGLASAAPLLALPYLLGNLYPAFHGFRGGKGVAASVGLLLAMAPLATLLGGLAFLLVVSVTKLVSLGSIFLLSTTALLIFLLPGPEATSTGIVATTMAMVTFYTHRENIQRITCGTEIKLSIGKTKTNKKEYPR